MKNFNYTIEAIVSDTHDNISNKVLDCVGTSIADRGFSFTQKMEYITIFADQDVKNKITDDKINSIYQNTLTVLDNVLNIQYMIDISKIGLKTNRMKNVKYILADKGFSFTQKMGYVTVFSNQDIKDKITDEKINSIYQNTMTVLNKVENTIYDKY
jgi:ABC-type dipeptide/oligopeptide/nickel transport system ATPase component